MRQVAVLRDEASARVFGDYLIYRLGIENTVEEDRQGWVVWVHDEAQVERAHQEFEGFRWHPEDAKYRSVTGKAEVIQRERERERARREQKIIKPQKGWHLEMQARFGPGTGRIGMGKLTITLIVVSIAVAVGTRLGEDRHGAVMQWLYFGTAGSAWSWRGFENIAHGQVWRLITPIFIHLGFLHILFNMWWLRDLGSLIEAKKGILKLGVLVLGSGVAANVAQCLWAGPFFGGMSGVVYALFGYLWVKGKVTPSEGLAVGHSTIVLMIAWLFFCMTGLLGPIANTAHVVGLLAGAASAYLPYRWRRWQRVRTN